MGRAYLAVCGVVVCAAIFASCGSNRDCSNGSFCNDPDGGDATLVEGGGTDTGLIFGDTGGGKDGGGCNVTCSGDLHNVIDCNNNVVLACPPDQGCANGACAPACDAAKANKAEPVVIMPRDSDDIKDSVPHLIFNVKDMKATVAAIKANGGSMQGDPRPFGNTGMMIGIAIDPVGNRIELIQRP